VAPATDVTVAANGQDANVNWTPSSDSVQGYNVYRATDPNGPFTRINNSLVKGTSFSDANAAGTLSATSRQPFYYMVRAVKLEKSASGTYFNPSEGAFASLNGASAKVAKASASAAKPVTSVKPQAKADISALGRDLAPTGSTNGTDTIW